MSSPRPLSPVALDALSRLAVDPLARVHQATRAGLLSRELIYEAAIPCGDRVWSVGYRVTSAGHALLEGHEG